MFHGKVLILLVVALLGPLLGQAEDGESRLIDAANRGDVATVLELVGVGTNVNAKDPTGVTALTQAAWGGHSEIARILLVSGADPDTKDDRADMTALMWAVWKGYSERELCTKISKGPETASCVDTQA